MVRTRILFTVAALISPLAISGPVAARQASIGSSTAPQNCEPLAMGQGQRVEYGGERYTTRLGGSTFSYVVPPAGFDPATAPQEELAAFNYPARPEHSSPKLEKWLKEFGNPHLRAPRFCLSKVTTDAYKPGPTAGTSSNWAGAELNAAGGEPFNSVNGSFTQTGYVSLCPDPAYSASWVGLGGVNFIDNYQRLIQAGTITNGSDQNYFFYEYLEEDTQGNLVAGPPGALLDTTDLPNPGDTILSSVWVDNSGNMYFDDYDNTTGQSDIPATIAGSQFYDGSTAEFIDERPFLSTGLPNLRAWDHGAVLWSNDYADYGSTYPETEVDVGASPYTQGLTMQDSSGNDLASYDAGGPSGIGPFADDWLKCS